MINEQLSVRTYFCACNGEQILFNNDNRVWKPTSYITSTITVSATSKTQRAANKRRRLTTTVLMEEPASTHATQNTSITSEQMDTFCTSLDQTLINIKQRSELETLENDSSTESRNRLTPVVKLQYRDLDRRQQYILCSPQKQISNITQAGLTVQTMNCHRNQLLNAYIHKTTGKKNGPTASTASQTAQNWKGI